MKTKDLLKTKLSSLAGPPLRQPRPLDERLRPARRQPDDHDDRDGRQSGIRLRRPQATVETFTQVPDYTVTFQADGATVKTMTVEDGYVLKDSDYPAVPTKTGYTGEWVKYTSAVHSNVTVQAKYTAVVTKYTVTFKADNTVVKTMTVKDGYTLKASDYPTVPAKSGYTGEWVKYTAAIHSDITINAVYEPSTVIKQYTVVFRADAKVLKTMKVEVGYTLQDSDYPEIPAKEGYTGHWDKSTTRIIKNTIINVIYSDNSSHVVTFIFDGAQIGTLTVTDGYVLKNSDYPSPFAPVGYIVTWEKYTLPIHSDITVTGKLQSDVTIPPQPTSPGEIMSGGEGEPVEADAPAEDETVAPQGMHVTGTQTVTHEYLTLNGKVARETIRTNNTLTAVLDFIYDESGKPFALKYSTDGTSFKTYYYVLNLQGDVVKLIQESGGVVARYTYDAWGNLLDSGGNLAEVNPLRYRGYYYDNETGFYYLQSRYYDPANRRFINADRHMSTGQGFVGTNMFAYCDNSPVFLVDHDGDEAETVEWWAATMWWLCAVDGPIPVGDIIYGIGLGVCGGILVYEAVTAPTVRDIPTPDAAIEQARPETPEVTSQNPPTEKDGYIAPKGGPRKVRAKNGQYGWLDANGNVWVPAATGTPSAHGGGHWDVQSKDGNGYTNVYPGGKSRGGKGSFPKLPSWMRLEIN